MKRFLFISVVLGFFCVFPAIGFELEPIPEGVNFVCVINNFLNLPLQDLVSKNPCLPKSKRELIESFIKVTAFNPFLDLFSFQLMVQIKENRPAILAAIKGKFDKEKIVAMIKLFGSGNVIETKIGDWGLFSDKRGFISLSILDTEIVIGGSSDLAKQFLEDKFAKKQNPAFADLIGKFDQKAYLTLMIKGDELFSLLLENIEKAAQKRPPRDPKKALFESWIKNYFLRDLKLNYFFAHKLEDRFEAWLAYDRGETKDLMFHVLTEVNDKKFFVTDFFKALVGCFSEINPPETPASESTEGKEQ